MVMSLERDRFHSTTCHSYSVDTDVCTRPKTTGGTSEVPVLMTAVYGLSRGYSDKSFKWTPWDGTGVRENVMSFL